MEPFNQSGKEKTAAMLQTSKTKRVLGLGSCTVMLMTVLFILLTSNLSLAENANQLTFSSPEEAVSVLVKALKSNEIKALETIFGPTSKDIISSGDPVADQSGRADFLKLFEEKNYLEPDSDKMILVIGNDDWPFPIPIVEKDSFWFFDTEEGSEEILARRIGRNELDTIQVCMTYVDAQQEYAQKDRDADGLFQYAEKIRSNEGKKNGLYWDVKEGEDKSPMGLLIASAQIEGYNIEATDQTPIPYHGYYYRILKGQGKNAPGGAIDYMVKGEMTGGFAMIAFPASYESSGIMTFIVNNTGVVYQRDLGPDTEKAAQLIDLFDPDDMWKKVEEKDMPSL